MNGYTESLVLFERDSRVLTIQESIGATLDFKSPSTVRVEFQCTIMKV